MFQVGTDPREARYWLTQFQRSTEIIKNKTFAIVHIDASVFHDYDKVGTTFNLQTEGPKFGLRSTHVRTSLDPNNAFP